MKKPVVLLLACAVLLCSRACGAEAATYPVTFSEDQTTGKMWFCTVGDEAVLAVDDQGYQTAETASGAAGDIGTHTWVVSGKGAGEASVRFTYTWVWVEEPTDPDITYTFSSDGAGGLTLLSTDGQPEQFMPGKTAVRLWENPTTGYQWSVEADTSGILSPVSDAYEQSPDSAGTLGAEGIHTWIFDIEAPGTVALAFRYARSFAPGDPPAAAVTLTYRVDENKNAVLMGLDGDYDYLVEIP